MGVFGVIIVIVESVYGTGKTVQVCKVGCMNQPVEMVVPTGKAAGSHENKDYLSFTNYLHHLFRLLNHIKFLRPFSLFSVKKSLKEQTTNNAITKNKN